MRSFRHVERGLLRWVDRAVDSEGAPPPYVRPVASSVLRGRHLAIHWAIRRGLLWDTSTWRLAVALAVEPGDTVLDLGANLGRFSQEAAWRVGPSGRVYAFEPSPGVADRFARRMERLGLSRRVLLHRCAVGAREGTTDLYEYAHRDGGASSVRPQPHVGREPDAVVPVPVVALDEVLDDVRPGRLSLVKIDVEGAEVEALQGARRTLTRPAEPESGRTRRPVVVVEAAPVTQEGFGRGVEALLHAIHELGFATWACRPRSVVAVQSAADLLPDRRREDLMALHPIDHAETLARLRGLAHRAAVR